MPSPELNAPNLRLTDLLAVLRRRWPMVAVTTAVIMVLLLGYSLSQAKRYTATARILERTVASDTATQADPNAAVPFFADRQVQNAVQTILSTNLRAVVAAQYHGRLNVQDVTATQVTGSDAIDISVTAGSPHEAADLVNLYARTYIGRSTKSRSAALATGQAAIKKEIAAIDTSRARVTKSLDTANSQVAADPKNQALVDQRQSYIEQLSTLDIQRTTYVQRLESLQLSAGLTDVQSAALVRNAVPPSTPISPKPVRDAVIGLMLGLGLGIAIAFAREFLDDSVRTTSDLDALTDATVPTLGVVPSFDDTSSGIVTISAPASLAAEAFRAVRTSVRFVAIDRAMKIIQITSTGAGEGKTTVVANLAAALTQAGHRVAVVSCDLRRPELHNRFGEPSSPGLTDVLLGECLLSEAIRQTGSGVYLLPSGDRPPNPSELLGSSRMKAVLDFLATEFDFVLLDSTPVVSVTDAVVVSQFAQATLVVVAARVTARNSVREALDILIRAGAPLAGLILNKASARDDGGYDLHDAGRPAKARAAGKSAWTRVRAQV